MSVDLLYRAFDETGAFTAVAADATHYINVVGIYVQCNDTDSSVKTEVRLIFSNPTTEAYGSGLGATIVLKGDGGDWGLQMNDESIAEPYFKSPNVNSMLVIGPTKRISGIIYYYLSDT